MDERLVQFRVGVVVVATVMIAIILVLLFGEVGFGRQKTLHVLFTEAPGTRVDTPVRKSGILIGRVRAVQFEPDGRVRVTIGVNDDVRINRGERCQIQSSLLGNAVLEFVPGDDSEKAQQAIEHGDEIEGYVVGSPLDIIAELKDDLGKTVRSLGKAGEKVSGLAERIEGLLPEDNAQLARIMNKTEVALDGFSETLNSVNSIFGDKEFQGQLRDGLKELPSLIVEAREAMSDLKTAVNSANRNLKNLEGFTGPLGERGPELVAKVEGSVEDLSQMLRELASFSQAINSGEGTIGKLVHDRELYDRLNLAASNIQRASQQLRPILSDVRVFTDKIARDPSQIGVGGAIRKRTGIK